MMEVATTGSGYLAVALVIKHHCLVTEWKDGYEGPCSARS
jgi:hypothetical protein